VYVSGRNFLVERDLCFFFKLWALDTNIGYSELVFSVFGNLTKLDAKKGRGV